MPLPATLRYLTLAAGLLTGPAAWAQTPALTGRSPQPNANNAPPAGPLTATFSQPLNPATAGGVRVHGSLRQGQRAGTATVSGSTLRFQPTVPFLPGEQVQVTLPATVQGSGGAAIAPQVYQFRAAAGGVGEGKYIAGPVLATTTNNVQNRQVLTGDLDNDGDLDLIVLANYGTQTSPTDMYVYIQNNGAYVAGPLQTISANMDYSFLADIDSDGDLDLGSLEDDTYLAIRLNNGAGVFTPSPALSHTLLHPSDDPQVADLNGDGYPDLVLHGNSWDIYLNDGTGNLLNSSSTSNGVASGNLRTHNIVDIDEDGDLDILHADSYQGMPYIGLNLNQGNGTFVYQRTLLTGVRYTDFVLDVLDFNNDHHPDIVYKGRDASNVLHTYVLYGPSLAGTSQQLPGSTTYGDTGGTFGDVDADGDLDYVYESGSSNVITALNDGQGNLTTRFTTALPATATYYQKLLCDLDGDGDLDLLTFDNSFYPASTTARDVLLYFNQPIKPAIVSFSPAAGVAGTAVTLTGFNLDALTSVAFNGVTATVAASSPTSATVLVPAGTSTGPITATSSIGTGTSATPFTVRLAVVATSPPANGVGATSLITATLSEAATGATGVKVIGNVRGDLGATLSGNGSPNLSISLTTPPVAGEKITVTLPGTIQTAAGVALGPYTWSFVAGVGGTGTGNFQPGYNTTPSNTNGPKTVLAADLNHDGLPDLVALQPDAPDENVLVALNTGTGGTLGTPALVPIEPNSKALALADVNGDGHLDLLTSSQFYNYNTSAYTGQLSVRLGTGSGGFAAIATVLAAGTSPYSLAVGDVNGDGRADVVAADYTTGNLLAYLNTGTGLGAALAAGTVDNGPTDLALADVNNDGRLDVLTAAYFYFGSASNPGRVSVRLGTGGGTFAGSAFANVDRQTSSLAVGDLNGDHLADIVSFSNGTGGSGTNAAQVSLGLGNGSFSQGQSLALGGAPIAGTLGDLDADGDLDVVVANFGSSQLNVLRNDGGTLVLRPSAAANSSPNGVALADLDLDGDLDAAVANFGGGRLTVRFNQPGPPPPPTISSFTPASGGYGTLVTITGTGLTGTSSVKFNGTASFSVTAVSSTQVTANVPYGATSGLITLTTPGGTATSSAPFTVLLPPTIYSFAPASGPVGTEVTVTGEHLTGVTDVSFNGLSGTGLVVDSDTQLRVTVPAGASTSYLVLTGPGGTSGSQNQFVVTGNPPSIYGFGPTSGTAGTQVYIFGSGFTGLTGVAFNGTAVTTILGTPTDTQLYVEVPAGATTGPITVTTATGTATSANSFTLTGPPAPANDQCGSAGGSTLACGQQLVQGTTTGATGAGDPTTGTNGLTPSAAAGGVFYQFAGQGEMVTVSLCNSTFAPWGARLFVYSGSCGSLTCVAADAASCNNTFPSVTFAALAGTTYTIMVNGAGSSQGDFLIGVSCDLTVSYSQTVPAGTYQNLVIMPQATATLGGPVAVQNQVQVQPGGTLLTACQPLTGPGSFSLGSGATLGICHAAGLGLPGSGVGAVQLSGPRTLSPEARYVFNGSTPQQTGAGLPAQAQALTVQNPAGVSLSQSLSVSQLVRLGSGSLTLGGQYLTLLSGAGGTALIDNAGGQVLGATGQMQRFISPALNPLSGYRHFSAPVSGNPVQQLTTPGYTPQVNANYNTSAAPGGVRPYPTIFGYDESRLTTSPAAGLSAFDKGWQSPGSLGEYLVPGRGYTVQLPPAALCTFQGTFTTGDVSLGLTRGPQADAGWHLLGNPYPAPIDWDAPGGFSRSQVADALYVFESSGPYTGQYRAYVNGLGPAGANLVAAGQAFFVRVADGAGSGSFTFHNAARLTDFGAGQPVLHRTLDTRPRLTLRLAGSGPPDDTYLYFETGATTGFDAAYDAAKLLNPGGISLATELAGQRYAINGLPTPGTPASVALAVQVPQAGVYTFEAAALASFNPGQTVTLRDALTGTRTVLTAGTRYACTLTGTEAPGRFWLDFGPAAPLATSGPASTADWQVLPNPSPDGHLRLLLPLATTPDPAAPRAAELRDALGRLLRRWELPRPSQPLLDAGLEATDLPPGVYLLHLRVGEQTAVRRVVLGR